MSPKDSGVALAVIEGLAKQVGQLKASLDQATADFRGGIARADRERNLLAVGLETRDEAIEALKARSDMRDSLVKDLLDGIARVESISALSSRVLELEAVLRQAEERIEKHRNRLEQLEAKVTSLCAADLERHDAEQQAPVGKKGRGG